jgi:hypothetical protein
LILLALVANAVASQDINQESRILGALSVTTNSLLFDTISADAIVSALR